MAASERFSLLIDTQTRGTQEIERMEAALNKLYATVEKTGKKTNELGDTNAQLAKKIKDAISNPLDAAGKAAESFVLKFGKVGVGMVATAAVASVAGAAMFKLVADAGKAAEGLSNLADRTGLTINQTDKLAAMSKIAGISIEALEGSSKVLAATLEDTSGAGEKAQKVLQKYGIAVYEATGQQRDMGQVMLQLIERLSKVSSQSELVAAATATLGRGSKELLPLIKNYNDLKNTVEALGYGLDENLIKKLAGLDDKIDATSLKWDLFKRKLADGLSVPVSFFLDLFNGTREAPTVNAKAGGPADRSVQIHYGAAGAPTADQNTLLDINSAIDNRNRGNAFLKTQLGTPTGLDRAITEAKEDIARLQTKLATGNLGASEFAKESADLKKRQADLAGYTEQLKLLNKEEAKRIALLEKIAELNEQGEGFYLLGKGSSSASIVTSQQVSDANKAPIGLAAYSQFSAIDLPTTFRYTEGKKKGQTIINPYQFVGGRPEYRSSGQFGAKESLPTFVSPDADRTGLDLTPGEAGLTPEQIAARGKAYIDLLTDVRRVKIEGIHAEAEAAARLIELRAGPGGEFAAAERVAALRKGAIEEEFKATQDVGKYQLDLQQLRLDREVRIAEIARQQVDRFRNFAQGGFDALFGGGGGLSSFIKSQALGVGSKVAGNAATEFLLPHIKDFIPQFGGTLGKVFGGTSFSDPLKTATDINTLATERNTAATAGLAAKLGFGGGSLSGVAGAGQGFLNLLSGGTSSKSGLQPNGEYLPDSQGAFNDLFNETFGITSGPKKIGGLTKGIGFAAAGIGGAIGAYDGFSHGGARGALEGTGSLAGASGALLGLAGVTGPAAPILAGVGLALGLSTMLFGDPKKKRAAGISSDLANRQFTEPTGTDYLSDIHGNSLDYDYRGGTRVYRTININVTNDVSAVDGNSIKDMLVRNPDALSAGLTNAITSGNGEDVVGTLRQVL